MSDGSTQINMRRQAYNHRGVNYHLTTAEKAAYDLMKQGLQNKEIALALGIKIDTVKRRVATIKEKLSAFPEADL